jgi:hypothetical protein
MHWLPPAAPFPSINDHRGVGQQQGKGVLWIDFDQIGDYDEIARVFDQMQLPDFDLAMLGHLVACVGPDDPGAEDVPWFDPHVDRRLRARTGVRYLKAFALREDIALAPVADRELPRIYWREIFFLVSDRWVITRRRRGMSMTRGIFREEENAVDFDELLRTLEERWLGFNEPHDAATLMLRIVADEWLPAIARVGARLQNSELGYVRGLDEPGGGGNLSDREYRQELVDIKWVVDGLSGLFTRLLRPGVKVTTKWFRVKSAEAVAREVDELLELAGAEIGRHREQLRESFDLIATTQTSRQIELAGDEQRRGRRLEFVVTLATAGLLVPALIAAAFGAVPDELANRGHLRLGVMLIAMAAAALVSFVGLRLLQATGDEHAMVAEGGAVEEHEAVLPPAPLFIAALFWAVALLAAWQADDRAAAYGVVLLALGAFLMLPRLIAPWFGGLARRLFGGAERRRPASERRSAEVLSDIAGVTQLLLWVAWAVFGACVILVTVDIWKSAHEWLLRIAFAVAIALYAGLLFLWLTYATREAAADRGDALSGDVTIAIGAPLERSAVVGVLTVAAAIGGAACIVYSVWT